MKLLVRDYDNVILTYGNTIEKGVFKEADPVNEIIKVVYNENTIYYTTNGVSIYDSDTSSIDLNEVYTEKYCYTPDKGFYENPNWVEPDIPIEKKVSNIEDYTSDLLYQVCLLQLGVDDTSETTSTTATE